jgi:hypothetical protein
VRSIQLKKMTMRVACLCILVATSLFLLTKGTSAKSKIRSIASGTSFGFCRGYCRQSVNITSNPLQITAKKEPNFEQAEYPTVQNTSVFPSANWTKLVDLLDLKTFQALDEQIGCPDCADGGAEWIEVNWLKQSKRVTFENGQLVKGIEGLIAKLRKIRDKYLMNL